MSYMAFSPPVASFFISLIFGALLGILWDFFRLLRKKTKGIRLSIVICDIFYFVIACSLNLFFLYSFSAGKFRIFILIGEILGFILYYLTVEKLFFYLLTIVFNKLAKICKLIYSILIKSSKYFEYLLGKLLNFGKGVLHFIKSSVYNIFRFKFKK